MYDGRGMKLVGKKAAKLELPKYPASKKQLQRLEHSLNSIAISLASSILLHQP